MAGRRPNVGDIELQLRVLRAIWKRGEVIESELYGLAGNQKRITRMLSDFLESGIVKTRPRDHGQRVPVYSFTEKGRLYCLTNLYASSLKTEGTIDLETEEMREMYHNLQRMLRIDAEEGEDDTERWDDVNRTHPLGGSGRTVRTVHDWIGRVVRTELSATLALIILANTTVASVQARSCV